MVIATPTECAKNYGTCLAMPAICLEYQLFHYHAWSYYQLFFVFTILCGKVIVYILASCFCINSTSHAFTLHSLVIGSHNLHFLTITIYKCTYELACQ